jgi:hypothetical protein
VVGDGEITICSLVISDFISLASRNRFVAVASLR